MPDRWQEYKGYEITLSAGGLFECSAFDEKLSAPSVNQLREQIEQAVRARNRGVKLRLPIRDADGKRRYLTGLTAARQEIAGLSNSWGAYVDHPNVVKLLALRRQLRTMVETIEKDLRSTQVGNTYEFERRNQGVRFRELELDEKIQWIKDNWQQAYDAAKKLEVGESSATLSAFRSTDTLS